MKPSFKLTWQQNYRNILKYLAVGVSSLALDLGLLVLLREVFHWHVLLAATVSYWTSVGYNFSLNRAWTFDTTRSLSHHVVAYGLLLVTNYLATIIMIAGLAYLDVPYALAKILAVGLTVIWTYIIYKKVIFV